MILTYAKRRRKSCLAPFGAKRRVRVNMGRCLEKKVEVNGGITLHEGYIYHDYLQIACVDLQKPFQAAKRYITWDPTQSAATRPLAIQQGKEWYTYAWDLPKNIIAIFTPSGTLSTTYTYTPFGKVSVVGDVTQSIQWSSEYHDPELALVYYNYRYYNPQDGRWTRRDYLPVRYEHNSYRFAINATTTYIDIYGLFAAEAAVASGFVAANGAAASAVASAAAAAAPVVVVVGIVALTVWGVYTIVNNIEDDATVDEIESVEVTNTTFNYTECEIWCRKNYYACLNIKYYNKGCPLSAWIECNAAYDACLFGCSMGKWPTE